MYGYEPDPPPGERCCDHCGAANDPDSRECWLCERMIRPRIITLTQSRRRSGARSPQARLPVSHRRFGAVPDPPSFGMFVTATVSALAVATLVAAPGFGIGLLTSVVPALWITEARARSRWRQGRPMSAFGRAMRVVVLSFVVPIAVVLVLFAFVILIFAWHGAR